MVSARAEADAEAKRAALGSVGHVRKEREEWAGLEKEGELGLEPTCAGTGRRVLGRLGRKGNGVADWAKKRGKGRPGWFALGLGKLLRLFYSKPTQNY